jgi:hypothetical protein
MDTLDFEIVECSSEEEGFECSTLQTYQEDSDGWLSKSHCNYPQFLILKIQHQGKARVIDRLEILCHEFCIAQVIEISIASGSVSVEPTAFDECSDNLGYVTMEANEQSNWQDRELKSIPISKPADYIKLTLQQCYENKHNVNRQVGIVALRIFGAKGMDLKNETTTLPTRLGNMTGPVILPPHVKHTLDTKTQHSVERLEKLKKERAALEVSYHGICFVLLLSTPSGLIAFSNYWLAT